MNVHRKGLLVGAGYFSDYHLDAWKRIPNAEIVCVCDQDPIRAQQSCDKYGINGITTDIDEALRHDLDFVDIATTPQDRLSLIQRIAERQLPIICQKPLAGSHREACRILDWVSSHNVTFMVHENFRFQPWYREIKTILRSGLIGRKLHTLHMRTRTGDGWGSEAYLARQPYFRDMPRFLIHETGVHFVDTFRYLAGEIAESWADIRKLNAEIVGEDAGTLHFVFENGARGIWDANRYNEPRAPRAPIQFEPEIGEHDFNPRYTFGELLVEANQGSLWLDSDGSITIQQLGKASHRHAYAPSREGFGGDCVRATQEHFLQVLDGVVDCETDCLEYRKTLRVVEQLYSSASQRKAVACQAKRSDQRVIDLSLPVTNSMSGVQISPSRTIEKDGWNATTLTLYSHAGTHMDASCHFLSGGMSLEQVELQRCCGPARLVHLWPASPKQWIGVDHVIQSIGDVEPGDRLLFRTDWHKRFGTPEYRNDLPRISIELAHWLVEKQVAMIGVEPPSVADVNNMQELTEVHQTLFRGGIVIVEGLANLHQITRSDFDFIALPLRIVGGDGCPVRAIAIEREVGL